MPSIQFDNSALRELPGDPDTAPGAHARPRQVPGAAWSPAAPQPVVHPQLLAWSIEMATTLGLIASDLQDPQLVAVLGGNGLLPGMQPSAANYGGHQFGHWAGQLGDGRAISLGESINAAGERWEWQLKGAGLTPYSRTADGRAVLRSSIREFLCSEAMHHLGIPTTRALSLVGTGEDVVRDMFYDGRAAPEPGAIVCRVAPSFLRFGSFELPAARGDTALLRQLAEFCIWRDFPELLGGRAVGAVADPLPLPPLAELRAAGAFDEALFARWFGEVCARTAVMVSHWMRVGFVHGVMNTDNLSILGLTIDYGPYGWIDAYDPDWTPNTTDRQHRRYRFGWQPRIAQWNLVRLAQALSGLFDSVDPLQAGLARFEATHVACTRADIAGKLGLDACTDADVALMDDLQVLLKDAQVDMTLFFRALGDADDAVPSEGLASLDRFDAAFYDADARATHGPALAAWLQRRALRLQDDPQATAARRAAMHTVNPRYVLRNYLAQQAIDRAHAGDIGGVVSLQDVMRRPYDQQPGNEAFAARRPAWADDLAGSSMLSCSS